MAEDISKLPRWARDRIARLERERDQSRRLFEEMTEAQPEGPFYTQPLDPKTGAPARRHIACTSFSCEANGVQLEVVPRHGGIQVYFNAVRDGVESSETVYIVPEASNLIRFVARENDHVWAKKATSKEGA